jgi:murein DD-endopeptidase MepM/ murein hydrolase activator NlpD
MREHPVVGGIRPHHGVDLGCPVGTPVLATASGEVLGTGRSRTAGLWVRVGHVGGYSTFYAHLSEARVAKGDRVLEADTLALSGETGRVRGAHLHYELNWGGAGADSLSLPVDALHERRRSATEAAMAALPSRMPDPLHWKAALPTRAALDHETTAESDD